MIYCLALVLILSTFYLAFEQVQSEGLSKDLYKVFGGILNVFTAMFLCFSFGWVFAFVFIGIDFLIFILYMYLTSRL